MSLPARPWSKDSQGKLSAGHDSLTSVPLYRLPVPAGIKNALYEIAERIHGGDISECRRQAYNEYIQRHGSEVDKLQASIDLVKRQILADRSKYESIQQLLDSCATTSETRVAVEAAEILASHITDPEYKEQVEELITRARRHQLRPV